MNRIASISRRRWLVAAVASAAGGSLQAAKAPRVEVWKSPTCGCCGDWITAMRAAGFEVVVNDTGNTAARARLGVAEKYGSCHTALVNGYALEGHVPPREVKKLLAQRPAAVGLAVPGMPIGSPGMETGGPAERYEVILFADDGSRRIYARY